jgi:hypothetical protein
VQLVVQEMCSEQARAEGELAYSTQVHRVWRNRALTWGRLSGSRIVVGASLPLAVGRAVAHGLREMRGGGEWGANKS